ncbi:gamma-glutamyltransferase family protein [Pseudohongiella nitratireducens]|uniref:gamma-glutamyltransferase family protein n=1 Tax=Pseudohongiella nitratireducens TaxID=1768907 RepID=UPI0030EB2F2D|tara:strand:- start:127 stop:1833 length:1707 start_codon:yes stop_codon:yes gene_type:complete
MIRDSMKGFHTLLDRTPVTHFYRFSGLVALTLMTPFANAQSPNAFGEPSESVPSPAAIVTAAPGSRAQGWQAQGRSEVLARNGMVATSDPLASQAGLEILQNGGNAIDAAVAAAAVLDVTSPNDTSIAGDLFALIWVASEEKLYGLSAAGWAPMAWAPEYFTDTLGEDGIPGSGVNSTTVPGAVAGYEAMLERFGTMGFAETFERAATIAEQGWGLTERRHADLRSALTRIESDPDTVDTFLVDNEPPALYSIIRNPDLAKTLRIIQEGGADAFYRGDIAEAIVDKIQASGGAMTLEDLAKYEPEWVEPISTNYHGYDVHQLPPPGQGFAALEMLNILEVCAPTHNLNLADLGPSNPNYWHYMVEAKKIAYSDLQAYNADPNFEDVPLDQLLSKSYAADQCDRIDLNKATPPSVTGGIDGGTIYMSAADRWGNMVSLVHSVFSVYGSGVTVPGYGFILHNRGVGFTLEDGHPNQVAPRKRPFHSIIAGFVTKDNQPLMAFGNMGGSVQPETHAQHIVNMVDHGMNLQMSTDVARFTHSQNRDLLSLELDLYKPGGFSTRSQRPQCATG